MVRALDAFRWRVLDEIDASPWEAALMEGRARADRRAPSGCALPLLANRPISSGLEQGWVSFLPTEAHALRTARALRTSTTGGDGDPPTPNV